MSKTCCRMLLEPGASVPKRQGKHTLESKISHFALLKSHIFLCFFQNQSLLNKPSVGGSSVGSSVSGCSGVGATVGATVGCGFGGRGRGLHLWNYNNFRNIFFQYNNHFVFLNLFYESILLHNLITLIHRNIQRPLGITVLSEISSFLEQHYSVRLLASNEIMMKHEAWYDLCLILYWN